MGEKSGRGKEFTSEKIRGGGGEMMIKKEKGCSRCPWRGGRKLGISAASHLEETSQKGQTLELLEKG